MKMTDTKSLFILLILVFGVFSFAREPQTQLQELKQTSRAYFEAENYKWVLGKLATALKAERKSQAVTKAMKKIWSTAKHLDRNQMKTLLKRFAKASNASITNLAKMSAREVGGYIKSVTSKVGQSAGKLRRILAGSGDEAGNAALRMLNALEDALTKTGKVSKDLLRKAGEQARGLSPSRAKAYLDLLKKKFTKNWGELANSSSSAAAKGASTLVGTVVDGVFVFNDAVNIYYSDDDPEEKYIKATAKIGEYTSSTIAGAASTALGGGLGPGLVIALSANRVATLYTEMKMLEREKRLAKDAEQEVIINNGLLVRRQLLKISQKIKAGEFKNARFLLNKVYRFLLDMKVQNQKKLIAYQKQLAAKLEKAKYLAAANKILNTARYPYREASKLYVEGHNLILAKRKAQQSYDILKRNSKAYPELLGLKAMSNIAKLIAAINAKIANATDIRILGISGKKRVLAGEFEPYTLKMTGGIPDYKPVGIEGFGTIDSATVYWEAPKEPGKRNVSFTVEDDLGQQASDTVSITVVGNDDEMKKPDMEADSGLKVFVISTRKGIPYIFYSAVKSHVGRWSSEWNKKLSYEDKEKNEGYWVRVDYPQGGRKKPGVFCYCLPHGPYKRYKEDGTTLSETGFYNKGKKDGEWTKYSAKSRIESVTNYENGKNNGRQIFYNSETGKPDVIRNYKNGKRDGEQVIYSSHVKGGIKSRTMYQNGKLISGFTWSAYKVNGKIVAWIKRTMAQGRVIQEERFDERFHFLKKQDL